MSSREEILLLVNLKICDRQSRGHEPHLSEAVEHGGLSRGARGAGHGGGAHAAVLADEEHPHTEKIPANNRNSLF